MNLRNLVVFRDSGEVRSDALVEGAAGDAGLLEHGGHVRGGHVGPVLGGAQLVGNKPDRIIFLLFGICLYVVVKQTIEFR